MSLIAVLVLVTFVGILVLVLSGSLAKSIFIRRLLATGDAYEDVESAFRPGIAKEIQTLLQPSTGVCAGAGLNINRAIGVSGLSYVSTQRMRAWPNGAPQEFVKARQRCASGLRSPPSAADLYFCLQFNGTANARFSGTTFAGAAQAAAEVRAQVLDVGTGLPLSCGQYQAMYSESQTTTGGQGEAVLEISYSLYWSGRGQPTVFKRRNGVFYAPPM